MTLFPLAARANSSFDANMTIEYLQISTEFQNFTSQSGWFVHVNDDKGPKEKCPIQDSPKTRVGLSNNGQTMDSKCIRIGAIFWRRNAAFETPEFNEKWLNWHHRVTKY